MTLFEEFEEAVKDEPELNFSNENMRQAFKFIFDFLEVRFVRKETEHTTAEAHGSRYNCCHNPDFEGGGPCKTCGAPF